MIYPISFREHVLKIREKEGLTIAQTSQRFGVGIASITRWLKRIEPNQSAPRKRKIDLEMLKKDVEERPDDYQFERAKRFKVCQSSIHAALAQLNLYQTHLKTQIFRRCFSFSSINLSENRCPLFGSMEYNIKKNTDTSQSGQ